MQRAHLVHARAEYKAMGSQLNERHDQDQLRPLPVTSTKPSRALLRRKSSGLGGEIRAGDTGAPAITTLNVQRQDSPKPNTTLLERDKTRKPFSKRRKVKTLFQRWKRYALKHTWVTPLALLAVFAFLYALNPTPSNPVYHFIFLSYKLPLSAGADPATPHQYGKGRWDIAFVTFYTIVLSFTREFIMQNLLRPLATHFQIKSRAKQARFMEQMYTAIYFGCLGPIGLWVMSRTPVWYFNVEGMYAGYPHRTHEGVLKFYYLFQAAYWAQQAIVLMLGMEKPRKDFKELVGHHIVSLSLIALSYRFHFVYMGLAVYITHDISDFFLATSKVLNYLDSPIVGPFFGLFIVVWIYLRHYLNIRILLSEFNEFRTVGPFELNWETQQYKCWISQYLSTALLGSLQALNLFWLFFILRIAYRFVVFDVVKDERSDTEEDEEELLLKEGSKVVNETIKTIKEAIPEVMINGETLTSTGVERKATPVSRRKA